MGRKSLANASEELEHVSGLIVDPDVRSQLVNQADQLRKLADAERGPNHGRLDRHMNVLAELQGRVDGDLAEHVGHARDEVGAYREAMRRV